MSTISSAIPTRDSVGDRFPRTIGAALKGWWMAYVNWRMERLAYARLRKFIPARRWSSDGTIFAKDAPLVVELCPKAQRRKQ